MSLVQIAASAPPAHTPVARANSTRTAYQTDWRLFERWCSEQGALALPASTETLKQYLMHLAKSGRKASTVRRARISIAVFHRELGFSRPDSDEQSRTIERGIARNDSAAEQGAPPLLVPELERMMNVLGNTRRDERDRALILLGFAGAFRSCELVALNMHDITRTSFGLRVRVPRNDGVQTRIRASRNALLCPVRAVERWLARLPSDNGPLFRTVHGSRVGSERLAPRAVSRAVQRAAARAHLSAEYSSHSLRSGAVVSARVRNLRAADGCVQLSAAGR